MAAAQAEPRGALVERRYLLAFALVTSLFLSWALAASLNDVLIRQFRKALDLSRTQSSLVQFAFYIGYFCAALPAGLLIRRFGYKRAMLTGLGLYAAGALLFYPAAETQTYLLFLVALYTIAIGLAFLETAANPYVTVLGSPATAAARLNLSQGFYGIGAILGGVIGARFIFSGTDLTPEQISALPAATAAAVRAEEASRVAGPYLVIAAAMVLLALLIAVTRFPALPATAEPRRARRGSPFRALADRRLRWAVVAQFFYVGAQVGVWSFFIDFARELLPGLDDESAAYWFSGSLALLTIGRFAGAPLGRRIAPARLLAIAAGANVLLCVAAVLLAGTPAVACLWLTSLFMSIMFPTIFALGLEHMGEDAELGASFIIMSIIGGALIPPGMAFLSDHLGALHQTMLVPAACFAVCLAFALAAPRLRPAA